jgi:hypothetical protein
MSDKSYYILAAEDCAACDGTGLIGYVDHKEGEPVTDSNVPCPICHGEKYSMQPVEVFPHWVRGEVMFKLGREGGLRQRVNNGQ